MPIIAGTAHATQDTDTAMINSHTRINKFFQPVNPLRFAAQQLNAFAALDENAKKDAEEKAAAELEVAIGGALPP